VLQAKTIHPGEHLAIQRLKGRLRATRCKRRVDEKRGRDEHRESEGDPKGSPATHAHTVPKCITVAISPSLTNTTLKG
jgi:hypothetical protein